MKKYININDLSVNDITDIFTIATQLKEGGHNELEGKTFVLFFPESSIRTRVSYELAIQSLGGTIVSFPSDALDKKEDLRNVIGYLENWADGIIVRHNDYEKVKKIAQICNKVVINAMTSENHPCEVLTDLYTISKMRADYKKLNYLFVGPATNVGYSWYNAANKISFKLMQACPQGNEIAENSEFFTAYHSLDDVIDKADVVITDAIKKDPKYLTRFQITNERIAKMKEHALLNLTPPFYRGEVISENVQLESVKQFVGYDFKKNLLYVQAAIILWCLGE